MKKKKFWKKERRREGRERGGYKKERNRNK